MLARRQVQYEACPYQPAFSLTVSRGRFVPWCVGSGDAFALGIFHRMLVPG